MKTEPDVMKAPELNFRDLILEAALRHVADLKGLKADKALWDYCCGAVYAAHAVDQTHNPEIPGWLFVLGVRGGDRVAEAERMVKEVGF